MTPQWCCIPDAQRIYNGHVEIPRKRSTYEGLLAASRASLSLLLALPVDDKRRCLLIPPLAAVHVPGYVPLDPPPLKLPCVPRVIPIVGPEGGESGIGAALAAAADRDSKLSPEVSFCDYHRSVGSVFSAYHSQEQRQCLTWRMRTGYREYNNIEITRD